MLPDQSVNRTGGLNLKVLADALQVVVPIDVGQEEVRAVLILEDEGCLIPCQLDQFHVRTGALHHLQVADDSPDTVVSEEDTIGRESRENSLAKLPRPVSRCFQGEST